MTSSFRLIVDMRNFIPNDNTVQNINVAGNVADYGISDGYMFMLGRKERIIKKEIGLNLFRVNVQHFHLFFQG